jgi:hypothetical protein
MSALLDKLVVRYSDGASLLASRAPFFSEWGSSIEPDSIRAFVWNGFFTVSFILIAKAVLVIFFKNPLAA